MYQETLITLRVLHDPDQGESAERIIERIREEFTEPEHAGEYDTALQPDIQVRITGIRYEVCAQCHGPCLSVVWVREHVPTCSLTCCDDYLEAGRCQAMEGVR